MIDETQIINRLKARDKEALRLIYDLYVKSLLNHAYKTLLNQSDAEDVIHDLFIQLENLANKKKPDSSIQNWLYGLTHRMSIDRIKKNKRRQGLFQIFTTVKNVAPNDLETQDHVEKILQQLEPQDRSLIWLKEAEGKTYEEISDSLGISIGTLKSKVSRIKSKFKEGEYESQKPI